jgi:hypothetical protein
MITLLILVVSLFVIIFLKACSTAPRPAQKPEPKNMRSSSHAAYFCPEYLREPKPIGGQSVDAYAKGVEAWSKKVEEIGCVPLR